MEEIRTEPQSGGIAIGKAVLLKQPDLAAERREITAAEAEKEQAAFRRAAEQVREALRPLARTNAIFAAHLDMAEDATLLQGVEEKIAAGKNAEWALEEETEELSGMLESLEDAYLRERAADVRDVCRRMMAALKGVSETSLRNITEKAILFAEELHPSDTAQMDFRYIRGMVTEKGGATSHVAILARSLEIPALLGDSEKGTGGRSRHSGWKGGAADFFSRCQNAGGVSGKAAGGKGGEAEAEGDEPSACCYNGWAAGRAFCQCRQSQGY